MHWIHPYVAYTPGACVSLPIPFISLTRKLVARSSGSRRTAAQHWNIIYSPLTGQERVISTSLLVSLSLFSYFSHHNCAVTIENIDS